MSSSASPSSERAQTRGARSKSPGDTVQWPYEPFPAPPPDGYWIPKFGPLPPLKFPSSLLHIPPDLTLRPPLMSLAYPPPPPLDSEDPGWLEQVQADVERQRTHVDTCLLECQTGTANAYAESGLADAELEEEMNNMQAFLNTIGSAAGPGYVRRLLEDVQRSVEAMSKPQLCENGDGGSEATSSSSGSTHGDREPGM